MLLLLACVALPAAAAAACDMLRLNVTAGLWLQEMCRKDVLLSAAAVLLRDVKLQCECRVTAVADSLQVCSVAAVTRAAMNVSCWSVCF
jgi:hypothetical protein